jgi:hypothetical protein
MGIVTIACFSDCFSFHLLCRFDCMETLMVQLVLAVVPQWLGPTTKLLVIELALIGELENEC